MSCVAEYTFKYRIASLFGSRTPTFRYNQYHTLHTDTIPVIFHHFPILTACFPMTNWNVFPSLQPISLSPIEMSIHIHNLFPYHQLKCLYKLSPYHQLKCPSIFTTYFLVTNFFFLPFFHNLFPYNQFHCSSPISISSFKIVALQKVFQRILYTPLLSNCKNHRVLVSVF